VSLELDTKLGTDHAYTASMAISESAQFDGELISAYATVLDDGKNEDDGSQMWTVETSLKYKKDPKHDATTVLKLDIDGSKDDTFGLWVTANSNLGKVESTAAAYAGGSDDVTVSTCDASCWGWSSCDALDKDYGTLEGVPLCSESIKCLSYT